jgi:nucleotide-binding universal stress UspA family protein
MVDPVRASDRGSDRCRLRRAAAEQQEFLGLAPMPGLQLDPEFQADLESAFKEEWCRPLAEARVRYRTVVGHGRPASVIDEVAQAENADMVIVGRRGRGEVAELMLGSVSHELSHRCSKPVLLVSHGKTNRKEHAPVTARLQREAEVGLGRLLPNTAQDEISTENRRRC